jgi:hypothetical protein
MIGISIISLVFYVFGLPAFTLGSMLYAKRRDLLKHPQWLSTLGLFYREYGNTIAVAILPNPTLCDCLM